MSKMRLKIIALACGFAAVLTANSCHFLGGITSNLVVSLTVTGDRWCRATDTTYRLDTPSAQEFLSRFGLVPVP